MHKRCFICKNRLIEEENKEMDGNANILSLVKLPPHGEE